MSRCDHVLADGELKGKVVFGAATKVLHPRYRTQGIKVLHPKCYCNCVFWMACSRNVLRTPICDGGRKVPILHHTKLHHKSGITQAARNRHSLMRSQMISDEKYLAHNIISVISLGNFEKV